ncbi:MAG: division/cell wall cluster transcriptional repressor MraZ [Dehalococcoidia bacterium]|nr:division/cell wall cluster transcriptional repressor MraZ [Dehalococcoidia bacterium]
MIKISMFLGEYEYKIDPKGRIAIPPRFRGQFSEGIVLAKGFDHCVNAYPPQAWKQFSESFNTLPPGRSKSRRIDRFLFASSFSLELDEQGRVLLPPPLRQYARIKETLVIAGVKEHLEIWSKELWDEEQAQMEEEAWQIAEGMETRQ